MYWGYIGLNSKENGNYYFVGLGCRVIGSRGLNRWDEGRWVKGSLADTLLKCGIFLIHHLPVPHLVSPPEVKG